MAKSKPTPEQPPAEYTVVARRYRPRQFADLIGQEHVATALANALTSGRVAHAYLFTGARGVGKTSSARILAKALNCEKGPTPTPCDVCPICLSIAAGDDMDVLEIDGASNNKVDEIRDLRQNVGFRPQRARYKIYIIDEVHMLSNSAFNALLKTLEEPPAHVKFIFATTEVQKIPVTILSRCQRFDFAAIGPAKIFATLKHIVAKEGLKADDDALQIVARRAAGSMRDAQTLLDQLLGFASDGTVTAATVHGLLGTAGDDRVADLAAAILAKDAKAALDQLTAAADRGLQLGELLDQLVDHWRGLMLVLVAGPTASDLPGTPTLHDQIRNHAKSVTLDAILVGLDIMTATKAKLRGSPHTQVLLEVAVVRLARLDDLLSVSQLVQAVTSGAKLPPATSSSGSVTAALPASATALPDPSKKNSLTNHTAITNGPPPVGDPVVDTFPVVWERVLQEVGPVRGVQLRSAGTPAIIGPNALAIRFPAAYSSSYEACASDTGQTVIRNSLKKVTGQEWTIRVDRAADAPAETPLPPPTQERKKDVLQLPLFRKAADVLGAQLLRMDDGFNPLAAGPLAASPPEAVAEPDDVPVLDSDEV